MEMERQTRTLPEDTVVLFTVRVHLLRVYDEVRSRAIASSPLVAVKATPHHCTQASGTCRLMS